MESLGGFAPTPSDTPRSQTPMQRQDKLVTDTPSSSAAPTATTATQDDSPMSTASKSLGLDKEVQSVVSGFSSFWGSIKKQGTAALQTAEKQYESARADLTPLISQARANLDHLGEQTRAELQRLSEAPASSQGIVIGADGMPVIIDDAPPPAVDKGKGVDRSGGGDADGADTATTSDAQQQQQQTPAAAASAFFASLAKNPNVQELSRNLSTLQTGVSRNLHQIQSQLTHLDLAEGQKVAEDYLHKGEHWFQDFSHEVSKLASDALKVVPPDAASARDAAAGGDHSDSSRRTSMDKSGAASAMSRRELILYKLRTDTALLLADPAASADSRDSFAAFVAARGAHDDEASQAQVGRELEMGGEALQATHDALVPAQLDDETFWTRYFWRKETIEAEEERRKKVLQIADQSEDDFSWDMDDEDGTSAAASPRLSVVAGMTAAPTASLDAAVSPDPTPSAPSSAAPPRSANDTPTLVSSTSTADSSAAAAAPAAPTSTGGPSASSQHPSPTLSLSTTAERSPRASSDGAGSYDVVDAKSGNPSGDELGGGEKGGAAADKGRRDSAPGADEDEDSDWE
ncbi:hypothetical protein JCM8208_000363 [Rhodotorula glutinis]